MGGNATKVAAKKAVKPLKNVFVEERAMRVFEKHKTNPTPAPRHPTTQKIIEKHVQENPHIEEEVKKEDVSLIDRVNRLHLEVSDDYPKFQSKARPLPTSTERVDDPMKAFEDPKRVPKGHITYRMLLSMLEKQDNNATSNESTTSSFEAEVFAKENNLNAQDVTNIFRYFTKVDVEAAKMAAQKAADKKDNEIFYAYETDDEEKSEEKLRNSETKSETETKSVKNEKKTFMDRYFKKTPS